MPLFLDACALAKRYLKEGESTRRMQQITGRFDGWGGFVVLSLIEPEVISAFGKYARAQAPHQTHFYRLHPRVVDNFRRDLSRGAFTIIPVSDEEIEAAADLLRAHPEYAIGAADAIHLATALAVARQAQAGTPLVFVTADKGLAEAARQNELTVFNPLYQRPDELEKIVGTEG
ncbi:MAG TPA: type II toxin-antitoxin system VapC family toxin [Longimicrobium sp.]|jgi:predicted nucleic acid-binding protein|uniref:type II toxin-antitoxin system VapC family toxin n=1 Tax=Longimicrobium sp. TaxID=2029185 RepID=UPI002ED9D67B